MGRRQDYITGGVFGNLCDDGRLSEAFELLHVMSSQGVSVPVDTFHRLLKGCIAQNYLELGRRVHALTVQIGCDLKSYVANHLIRMYGSQGCLDEACVVFSKLPSPNVFAWESIIKANADHGKAEQAIQLYLHMRQSGLKPNEYIMVAVLNACASLGNVATGIVVHDHLVESGQSGNIFIGCALVDMYAKCGSLRDARRVFDEMPTRDLVTWNAMIAGCVQQGHYQEALDLYSRMQHDGLLSANRSTYVAVLKACGMVGAINEGKQIHSQLMVQGLEGDTLLGNALVGMYSKCGTLKDAQKAFDRIRNKDVVTWTSLIDAYGHRNDCNTAMQCFNKMRDQGVDPDAATFACLIVACSHVGLVEEGQHYMRMMTEQYGIIPDTQHYNCMADLFSRSGRLDEAELIVRTMPLKESFPGWMSLLSSCKRYSNVELGRLCFDRLVEQEPLEGAAYVLMLDIYAIAGRWKEFNNVKNMMESAGAQKKPARASIAVNHKIQEFIVGEQRTDSSAKLQSLRMEAANKITPLQVGSFSNDDALCGHAEKLALAFGLLNTEKGSTLVVTKNLRMCTACHSGTKLLSKVEKREIVVRDAHRVHHFKDGFCSCGDHV